MGSAPRSRPRPRGSRGIDSFSKAVFHHLERENPLEERERIRDRGRDHTQRNAWQQVKDPALACEHDRGLYLRW